MTTSASSISLAGTSNPVSVAQELGLGLTTAIQINDAAVRTLAGAGGGGTVIDFNSLRNKANYSVLFGRAFSYSSGNMELYSITTNSSGSNIYLGGAYYPSGGGTYGFVAKLNSSGTLQWQTNVSASILSGSDKTAVLAIDSSENIYVVRSHPGTLLGYSVTKLNSSGNIVWSTIVKNMTANYSPGAICDSSNNLYVYSGGGPVNGSSTNDIFMFKMNSSGTILWSNSLAGAGNELSCFGNGYLKTDGTYLYAVGNTTSQGPQSAGYTAPIIFKVDYNGNLQWQRVISTIGTTLQFYSYGCAVDTGGNTFFIGTYNGSAYLCKLNSSGTTLWEKTTSLTSGSSITSAACDSIGNFWFSAGYNDLAAGGPNRTTVFKYNTSGTRLLITNVANLSAVNTAGNIVHCGPNKGIFFGGWDNNTTGYRKLTIYGFTSDTGPTPGTYNNYQVRDTLTSPSTESSISLTNQASTLSWTSAALYTATETSSLVASAATLQTIY